MAKNKTKNPAKKTQQLISILEEELERLEIRPCQGDADMRKKDQEILSLKDKIHNLEKDINQLAFYIRQRLRQTQRKSLI